MLCLDHTEHELSCLRKVTEILVSEIVVSAHMPGVVISFGLSGG